MWQTNLIRLYCAVCDNSSIIEEKTQRLSNLNYLSASLSHSMEELHAANAQLKTDIEKEREIERQRIDFFAAASHELKTPLTILKEHLSGMLNNVAGYEDHSKYLMRSLTVTEKMEKLIKELLYVSKMDSNKTTLKRQSINIAELLRAEIAALSDCISEKQLLLDVDIPDKIMCCLKKEEMERAIQNILVNAVRYSPEGERISVIAEETTEEISCRIENTGVNIPENTIPHLFEAFYRVDSSRNSNTGGTGLGLYIVRGIFERYGVKYGIINTEQGVRFWFKLNIKYYRFNKRFKGRFARRYAATAKHGQYYSGDYLIAGVIKTYNAANSTENPYSLQTKSKVT